MSAQLPDKQGRDSVVADQKAGDQVQRPVEVQSCSWELQGRRRSLGDQERAERADDQNPGVVRAGVPGEQRQMSGGVEDSEPLVNGEQISSIYSLKRELHISQEQRDRVGRSVHTPEQPSLTNFDTERSLVYVLKHQRVAQNCFSSSR